MRFSGQLSAAVTVRGPSSVIWKVSQLSALPQLLCHVTAQPDGKPRAEPPPFRVGPVEKVVDRIVRLIVKRRAEALLPGYVGPLLFLDQLVGKAIGNAVLRRKFPPDGHTQGP